MSGEGEVLARRVRYRCRSRGIRETGELLHGFLDSRPLPAEDLAGLERLLEGLSDPELLDCLAGRAPWPAWAGPVTARIDAYVRSRRPGPS